MHTTSRSAQLPSHRDTGGIGECDKSFGTSPTENNWPKKEVTENDRAASIHQLVCSAFTETHYVCVVVFRAGAERTLFRSVKPSFGVYRILCGLRTRRGISGAVCRTCYVLVKCCWWMNVLALRKTMWYERVIWCPTVWCACSYVCVCVFVCDTVWCASVCVCVCVL